MERIPEVLPMITDAHWIFSDPWPNGEWELYTLPREQPELGGIDNPAIALLEFLRDEVKAEAERQPKPQPQTEPWGFGSITGFPK
jgi:hypothetical protein